LLERIKELFTDPRTWATQLYFLLMLPLGIAYFTAVVTGLSVSVAMILAPVLLLLGSAGLIQVDGISLINSEAWTWPLCFIGGVVVLFATLHLVRAVGYLHGQLAKHMLVKSAQYD
jgi:hypothetical protein